MLDYLSFQLGQISPDNKPLPTVILGAAWAILTHHFGAFPASNPVFWVSIFWAMDWILGSCVAIKTHNWSPRRSFHGILKWLLWMAVLTVAWGIRDMGFLGCTLIGGMILAYLAALKFSGEHIGGRPLLWLGFFCVLGGLQFLTTGVIAELLIRIYYNRGEIAPYHTSQAAPLDTNQAWHRQK